MKKLFLLSILLLVLFSGLILSETDNDLLALEDAIEAQHYLDEQGVYAGERAVYDKDIVEKTQLGNGYSYLMFDGNSLILAETSDWQTVFKATTLTANSQMSALLLVHEKDYYPIKTVLAKKNSFRNIVAFGSEEFCEDSKKVLNPILTSENEIKCIGNKEYLEYYRFDGKNFDSPRPVVIADNDYHSALVASAIATRIQAPLFVKDYDSDESIVSATQDYKGNFEIIKENLYQRNNFITVVSQGSYLSKKYPQLDLKQGEYKSKSAFANAFDKKITIQVKGVEINIANPQDFILKQKLLMKQNFRRPRLGGQLFLQTEKSQDNHLIVYNPSDFGACTNLYSEYLEDTSKMASNGAIEVSAPSAFCKDSLMAPYYASVYGGYMVPLSSADGNTYISEINKLSQTSAKNTLITDFFKSFTKRMSTLDFNVKTLFVNNPSADNSKVNKLIMPVRNRLKVFNVVTDIFSNEQNLAEFIKPLPEVSELIVTMIGNPFSEPFRNPDKTELTELFLLSTNKEEALSSKLKPTNIGWVGGLTPGDTSAIIYRGIFSLNYPKNNYNNGIFANQNTYEQDEPISLALAYGIKNSKYASASTIMAQHMTRPNPLNGNMKIDFDVLFLSEKCNGIRESSQISIKDVKQSTFDIEKLFPLNKYFSVVFDLDQSTVRTDDTFDLMRLVAYMKNYDLSIEYTSHTDYRRDNSYNDWLSTQRAQAVKKSLLDLGVDENTIKYEAKGESSPKTISEIDVNYYDQLYAGNTDIYFSCVKENLGQTLTDSYIDETSKHGTEEEDVTLYECLMALNRRIDIKLTLPGSSDSDFEPGEIDFDDEMTFSDFEKVDVCFENSFSYSQYNYFKYVGNQENGKLPGFPMEIREPGSFDKNTIIEINSDKDIFSFTESDDFPPIAYHLLRMGAKAVIAPLDYENGIDESYAYFTNSFLHHAYNRNTYVVDFLAMSELPTTFYSLTDKQKEECEGKASCTSKSSLLERSKDISSKRLMGDPASLFTLYTPREDIPPITDLIENPMPKVLFSTIAYTDLAFNENMDYLDIQSFDQGVIDNYLRLAKGDFSLQNTNYPLITSKEGAKMYILVASPKDLSVQTSTIPYDTFENDGCILDNKEYASFTPSYIGQRKTIGDVDVDVPKIKVNVPNKDDMWWNAPHNGCFDVRSDWKNSVSQSHTVSVSGGKSNIRFKLYSYTKYKKAEKSTQGSKDCTKIEYSNFAALIPSDAAGTMGFYLCVADMPSVNEEVVLYSKGDVSSEDKIDYSMPIPETYLTKNEILDATDRKEEGFTPVAVLNNVKYVYDYQNLYQDYKNSRIELGVNQIITPDKTQPFVLTKGELSFGIDINDFNQRTRAFYIDNKLKEFSDNLVLEWTTPAEGEESTNQEGFYPYGVGGKMYVQSRLLKDGGVWIYLPENTNEWYKNEGDKKVPNILTQEQFKMNILDTLKENFENPQDFFEAQDLLSQYVAVSIYPKINLASTKLFDEDEEGKLLAEVLGLPPESSEAFSMLTDAAVTNNDEELGEMFLDINSIYFDESLGSQTSLPDEENALPAENTYAYLESELDPVMTCYEGRYARPSGGFTHYAPVMVAFPSVATEEIGKPIVYNAPSS